MGRVPATELMPEFAGRIIDNGRYHLTTKLGSGAYGKVYTALDTTSTGDTPKFYAIKCLNKPKRGSHTDLLQKREFSLHKLVTGHRNVVSFHHAFTDGLYVYVVLDLCPGGDLFSAITERHIFHNNGRLVKSAFIQLIDAVQHCHDLGVFHRDIKPENVLCSNDGGDIRLADFGLSIRSPFCHDFGCGSSYYMSPGTSCFLLSRLPLKHHPECIGREVKGENYSTRHNDVWALGVILTNMITGRNPWRYATSEDDCYVAYTRDPDFLIKVLPISSGVNVILKRVFTANPLRRISLPSFRARMLELNAFFIHDQDLATSSKAVIPVSPMDDDLAAPVVSEPKQKNNVDTGIVLVPSQTSPFDYTLLDEEYLFPSPIIEDSEDLRPPHVDLLSVRNIHDYAIGGKKSAHSLRASYSPPSSVSSGPESKGPITPATYAVEPDISIPDIPEEGGLGAPADFANAAFTANAKVPLLNLKSKRPRGHLFRAAVQRIKGLSGSTSS